MEQYRVSKTPFLIISVLLFVIAVFLSLYWFQYRPTKIKHECSWVTTHHDMVTAKVGLTEAEVFEQSGMNRDNFDRAIKLAKGEIKEKRTSGVIPGLSDESLDEFGRFNDGRLRVLGESYLKKMQSTEEVAAYDETRQATTQEYSFCLHDKGL